MDNLNSRIVELMKKDEWSAEEKQWLLNYLEQTGDEDIWAFLEQHYREQKHLPVEGDLDFTGSLLESIHQKIGIDPPAKKRRLFSSWVVKLAAASVVVLCVISVLYYSSQKPSTTPELAQAENKQTVDTILPGTNKALLTLADGSTIILDEKEDGVLADQGNTKVIKVNDKLVYNPAGTNNTVSYNTITTPIGGQYKVELADGTAVWLNAGSSLHFPTAFTGKERRVTINGEAYFEVAKNAAMPFIVSVNQSEIQVIGTTFNIMAYDDEAALETTLLHGSVKFKHADYNDILKPGQQTQLLKNGKVRKLSGVDVEGIVAWKNGMFDFEGADLFTVARQLSRWYNVQMVFDRKNYDLFYGKIPRNTSLKDVLKALELTGKVRFNINGNIIKVRST